MIKGIDYDGLVWINSSERTKAKIAAVTMLCLNIRLKFNFKMNKVLVKGYDHFWEMIKLKFCSSMKKLLKELFEIIINCIYVILNYNNAFRRFLAKIIAR